jgi:hypothetical protein
VRQPQAKAAIGNPCDYCGVTDEKSLSDADLDAIERRCLAASVAPWESFIEGREMSSGDSMIRVGRGDEPDMYVSRDAAPASAADLDFIANARQDIPRLLSEVRRLRRG